MKDVFTESWQLDSIEIYKKSFHGLLRFEIYIYYIGNAKIVVET